MTMQTPNRYLPKFVLRRRRLVFAVSASLCWTTSVRGFGARTTVPPARGRGGGVVVGVSSFLSQQRRQRRFRTTTAGLHATTSSATATGNSDNPHHHHHHNSAMTDLSSLAEHCVTEDMWTEYRDLMQDMMTRPRVMKKVKADALPAVQDYLMDDDLTDITPVPTDDDDDDGITTFRREARRRYRATFRDHWTAAQCGYLERCLCYAADWCARTPHLTSAAVVAWLKVRHAHFVPRENTVSTFLFVLSRASERRQQSSSASSDDSDDGRDVLLQAALADVALFHDACYPPNEKTVYLRIKSLIANGQVQAAEDLLQAIPDCQRLRTCTPLLTHYCRRAEDACRGLRLFRRMRRSPGVHLDGDTYVLLLTSLAARGYFSTENPPSHDGLDALTMVEEAGFDTTDPAALWDALLTEMADDLLELHESAAAALYQSLRSALLSSPTSSDDTLTTLPPAATRTPAATAMTATTFTGGRVTIDPRTCQCPATDAVLRLFALTDDQRRRVHGTLLDMASTQHEEFAAKMRQRGRTRQDPASSSGAYAVERLAAFADWVAGQNFTAIIDGPNVAYCGHPVLHYSQVALMVRQLEQLGERPLVTMPYKYCQPTFFVPTIGQEQTLSDRDKQVIAELQEKGQFYVVPEWCLDDYYWMIASVVANVTETSSDATLPGLRPLLITNDQMRDHRLSLLEPRLFRRWSSCHIVRYDFGPYDEDEWSTDRHVLLEHADSISREIQGNPTSNGATAWHIPIAEWAKERPHDRLCISIGALAE